MLNVFKKDTRNAEEKFWGWFQKNSTVLQRFIQGPERDFAIYQTLTKEMAKADPNVMPELTMDKGTHVLVLTVDGNKQGMPGLDRLATSFPNVPGWR
ncbi:MAG TPA: hypothetical protein VHL57_06435, partial [Flavobacteriales bacterium]|nr:hypothetical protein [Flavobacteriales bacterium]